MSTPKPFPFQTPIHDAISRLRFSPQSTNLLVSSWDSFLRLCDADSGVVRLEARSQGALLDCCFGEDESVAFSASSDFGVWRCDLHSGVIDMVEKHDDVATCVEYSVESGQLISAGWDNKLQFRDLRMAVGHTKEMRSQVTSLSLCTFSLMATIGRNVEIYDLRTLKEVPKQYDSSLDYQISCVRSFPNGQGYAIGSVDGLVGLNFFDSVTTSDTGFGSFRFKCHPLAINAKYRLACVNDIAFHPCSNIFVTGDDEGYTILWDTKNKKKLHEFPRYPTSVASLSYCNDGRLLAVASSYLAGDKVEASPRIFIHETGN